MNLSTGAPEILRPGKFKSTEWINITYRLYRLIRAPAIRSEIAPCYEVKTVECASEVKRLLSRKGIEASFFVEYPDVYVIRLNDGNLPEWFRKYFSEIKPSSVREVLGFDEGDLRYRFGDMSQSKSPYDVLRRQPYTCSDPHLTIEVYYERPEYWDALERLFKRHVDRVLREFVGLVPRSLKDIWDLDKGGVKLALLDDETLERKFREIAEIKSRCYYNGLSTLQLANGDTLLEVARGRSGVYYVANLLSALLFKSGCIPYYVELPTTHAEYLKLPRALYVGVGLKKISEGYVKGLAVLMTGLGNVVGYVDKDFHIKGRSMEFKEEELEEFVDSIKETLESYRNNARENPELVVAVRSRKFHDVEWRTLKRNFARRWLRLSSSGLLLMSSYKYVGIGPARAVEVGRTTVDGGLHGVWLVQLSKFKSAVKVSYFYTGNDATLPLAAYIYLRSLDFTSLTQCRTSLPPVKYARNYLRWKYPS
jgi:hypothetical protein